MTMNEQSTEIGTITPLPKMLTVREVAALLAVPVSTVHHWAARNEGPPSFKIGKHRRFFEDEVVAWVRHQRGA